MNEEKPTSSLPPVKWPLSEEDSRRQVMAGPHRHYPIGDTPEQEQAIQRRMAKDKAKKDS